MTHHFVNKRPMPSAWSAHIYGKVQPMARPEGEPTLLQAVSALLLILAAAAGLVIAFG